MQTTSLLLALFGSTAFCQVVTTNGISQISDGQIQAPATTTTSSPPYTNPFTSYTTETNSLGIITGMPSVVTSMPAVVTSQPSVYMWNTTSTVAAPETQGAANTSIPTTMMTSATTSAADTSFSFGSGSTTTAAASASVAIGTGGAVANAVGGAGLGLGAVGVLAVFLL
jgi:hypothetical protein